MENQKMRPLSEEELLLIEGGGLSELTHGLVRAAGYIMGRIAGHNRLFWISSSWAIFVADNVI